MKSGDNFEMLYSLAKKMNAAGNKLMVWRIVASLVCNLLVNSVI